MRVEFATRWSEKVGRDDAPGLRREPTQLPFRQACNLRPELL